MEKKTLVLAGTVAALALVLPACRDAKPEAESHPVVQAPLPTQRPFTTLNFVCASESLKVDMNGGVMMTSSATIHTFIDAGANKYRMDVVYSNGKRESEIFDGQKVWHLYPGDKTAQGESPPWPNYQVWDQAKPYAGGYTRREPLRGLDTLLMRADQSSYWVYKGVIVQSEMHGKRGIIIRNTLTDVKEDQKLDPGLFVLPKGVKKQELES